VANPQVIVDFIADTAKLVSGARAVAQSGTEAGNATKKIGWQSIAKFAAGAAALGAGAKFIKGAVDETEALAKGTMALTRTTGMDTRTASEWVSVLKTRNVAVTSFQRGMVTLSKQMEASTQGSKKSVSAFNELGVSMADIKAGNTQKVLMEVSDGLSKIENPAKRAALAQQLFSRAGLQLAPVLFKGSAAIQKQLDMAHKYGAEIGDTKGSEKLIANQRELALAMEGTRIKLGEALMPAIVSVTSAITSLVGVFQPLLTNATAVKVVLALLVTAFIAYKVAVIASTIASLGLNAAMLPEIAIVAAIVVGIAALIAIGILLYKHWGELAALAGTVWAAIQSAAAAAFNWLKSNWPLLVGILAGPFGLALALIITHWTAIKNAVTNAVTTIRNAITAGFAAVVTVVSNAMRALVAAILGAVGLAVGAATTVANGVKNVFAGAIGWLTSAGRNIVNGLASAMRGAVGLATSAAGAIESAVKRAFAGAGSWLYSAGRNIVMGLVSGIESAIGSAVGAVEHLASLAQKAFSLKNKIFSPSRVYADFGRQIVLGLAHGITRNAGLVTSAVGALGGTPTASGSSSGAPALHHGAIEVNVYIGDTELRNLVRTEIVTDNTRVARRLLAGTT